VIDATGPALAGNYFHVCIDDASRLAYSEMLPNERRKSAVAFLERALDWFARFGAKPSSSTKLAKTAWCRRGGAAHAADFLLCCQTVIADSGRSRYLPML
jgi:hypothetical protein